jgi:Peptidase S46
MILFVRNIDGDLRAVRKDYEENVEAPRTKYSGQIARAMFKVYGASTYPDATFTLRISYFRHDERHCSAATLVRQ